MISKDKEFNGLGVLKNGELNLVSHHHKLVNDTYLLMLLKFLSPAEYAATTRAKRLAKSKGKQFSKQPKSIAKKTARYR